MTVYELIQELSNHDADTDVQIEIDLTVNQFDCPNCGDWLREMSRTERVGIRQVYNTSNSLITLDCELEYTP